jgi:FdhD protein
MQTAVSPISIRKLVDNQWISQADLLAVEEPLEIRLQSGKSEQRLEQTLTITMRTPGNDFELAMGFLFNEGIIQDFSQIINIRYCENVKPEEQGNVLKISLLPEVELNFKHLQRHFYTSSSCGVCGKTSIENLQKQCRMIPATQAAMSANRIIQLPKIVRQAQTVFEYTGGLHAAALFDFAGNLIALREDVGRHNAMDKLIGYQLFSRQIPLNNSLILVSGRLSYELVQKTIMAGVPILAAIGAPSSLAVDLAQHFGLTLIGFLRENQLNIYTHPQRIQV